MTPLKNGWFVTGTDTDVGKTRVSTALLHLLASRGLRAAGYKPVAAGAQRLPDGTLVNEDVALLHSASTAPVTPAEVGPCVLQAACAPHIAAALEGTTLRAAPWLQGAAHLARKADWLVVEGAGGFALPLCPPGTDIDHPQGFDGTDLAAHLGLPVVLVVGLRTGCLNHAVLTAQAIRARGLPLVGWVANSLQADWPYHQGNVVSLHQLLTHAMGIPCWGVLPWLAQPSAAALAAHLQVPAAAHAACPAQPLPKAPA